MPVLPKYQLKLLFEAGDLITESTLNDFIDSSYNPVLVAGTGITLSEVTTPSGTTITITGTGGGGGVGTYTNSTPTPLNFPGNSPFDNIPAGTTFLNQTFTEMMDAMLYPTLDPTLTNPSSTFALTQAGLQEIGLVTPLNFNATFNRGSITPAYGTNGFRSGPANAYNYTGTGLPATYPSTSLTDAQNVGSYTVLIGNQNWTCAVSYDAGQQPLDSSGNNFGSPLPAGTTSPDTVTITGGYTPFATTVALGTLTKQPLQVMTTYIQVSLVTESGGGGQKQIVDIPDAWATITGLQQFNTLSGTWDNINIATFTTSVTTHPIQGNTVNYTRYTHNGPTIGARQLRFLT